MALHSQLPPANITSAFAFDTSAWQAKDLLAATTAPDLTTPAGLTAYLASTRFSAANVETLSGGNLGFTYRVTLKNPEQHKTVVVKHSLGYAYCDKDMPVSAERMTFEYEAMTAVARSGLVTPESVVQVPRVLFYDPYTHTLIMEDLTPVRPSPLSFSRRDFLGRFHQWSAQPEQAGLRMQFLENTASKETIPRVWYRRMMKTADTHGLKTQWMEDFVKQSEARAQNGGSVIIMGDFWVENILVSTGPDLRLYIIDWEMARCASPESDVGEIAAALHSISYINRSASSSFRFMESFMRNYNRSYSVDEVRIAFTAGLYVMSFGPIMSWNAPWSENNEEEVARLGFRLLEAGMVGNLDEIRKNAIVQNMY
ncbi:phosphotransferase enzyme family protein [Ceratobasidium sp. AG-Ba]|nr:phosphotransferase enzyme family protein [Ceratobasidium sp. AG-Ba]